MQMYSSIFQYLDYKLACLLYEVIDARLARLNYIICMLPPAHRKKPCIKRMDTPSFFRGWRDRNWKTYWNRSSFVYLAKTSGQRITRSEGQETKEELHKSLRSWWNHRTNQELFGKHHASILFQNCMYNSQWTPWNFLLKRGSTGVRQLLRWFS